MDEVAPLHSFVDDFVIDVGEVETFFLNESLEKREMEILKANIVRVILGVFVTDPDDFYFMSTLTELFREPNARRACAISHLVRAL